MDILVPRNLETRMEKLRQQILKLLQQEVIEGDVLINDLWDFSPDNIRTTTINCNVTLRVTNARIPQWLQNVTVNGSFNCSYNKLTSLDSCPKTVRGNFRCSANQLTSLEGCPQTVGRSFSCASNQLTSLEGCSKTIEGSFDCSYNQLTSLEGCPQTFGGNFNCSNNQLTSLKGISSYIGGNFYCSYNTTQFNIIDIHQNSLIKGKLFV